MHPNNPDKPCVIARGDGKRCEACHAAGKGCHFKLHDEEVRAQEAERQKVVLPPRASRRGPAASAKAGEARKASASSLPTSASRLAARDFPDLSDDVRAHLNEYLDDIFSSLDAARAKTKILRQLVNPDVVDSSDDPVVSDDGNNDDGEKDFVPSDGGSGDEEDASEDKDEPMAVDDGKCASVVPGRSNGFFADATPRGAGTSGLSPSRRRFEVYVDLPARSSHVLPPRQPVSVPSDGDDDSDEVVEAGPSTSARPRPVASSSRPSSSAPSRSASRGGTRSTRATRATRK